MDVQFQEEMKWSFSDCWAMLGVFLPKSILTQVRAVYGTDWVFSLSLFASQKAFPTFIPLCSGSCASS